MCSATVFYTCSCACLFYCSSQHYYYLFLAFEAPVISWLCYPLLVFSLAWFSFVWLKTTRCLLPFWLLMLIYNMDYQHNLCFITYFVAVNTDASHPSSLSHYYWIWSLRVKTHLQFCRQITWWVIFTPNEFIAFVNCLVNRKSVSSAIKYS